MNTRCLMELVILTIGLELGVIPPVLFAMMVLMALATTVMTTPLLSWIYPDRHRLSERGAEEPYTVLLPVALPSSGPPLFDIARALVPRQPVRYYALHLIRAQDQSFFSTRTETPGPDPLLPLLGAAEAQGVDVQRVQLVSQSLGDDLLATAEAKAANLIVMGYHKPVLSQRILGGVTGEVLRGARADVVVCVLPHRRPWRRILVPYRDGQHDRCALQMAHRLATAYGASMTILHVVPPEGDGRRTETGLRGEECLRDSDHVTLKVVEHTDPVEAAVQEAAGGYDALVIGADGGRTPGLGVRHERMAVSSGAALLIVRAGEPAR
jgi:nucleotide-binding universal stress UspA family protein